MCGRVAARQWNDGCEGGAEADGRSGSEAVLALNDANVEATGEIGLADLQGLVAAAFSATVIGAPGRPEAFLITFDQDAGYGSPNFLWFKARHARFAYVDRIVVAGEARGRGHARALYEDFFARARAAGHDLAACEVNLDPPNPVSHAFHAALGFEPAGEASLPNGKTVRYYVRPLGPAVASPTE